MRPCPHSLLFLLLACGLPAQNVCEGNAVAGAFLGTTPAMIGGQIDALFGSPTQPNGFAILGLSLGAGPVATPLGPLCLDVFSPHFGAKFFLLDGSGLAHWSTTVPNDPSWFFFTPFVAAVATQEAGGISVSKTVRMGFELPDSYDPVAATTPRGMHSATALYHSAFDPRFEVLLAGGATGSIVAPSPLATTTLFSAIDRTFRAGPSLALPRTFHRALRLHDGRVLITGGATTGNAGTATCEIYDPATNAMTLAAPMTSARMGHALTLMHDGRVFASGGFTDWTNAATNFAARLSTAVDSTEIYDPLANTWTPGPVMASARAGHSQTKLADHRLLIVGGVSGGQTLLAGGTTAIQVPIFTPSCQVYDPATNSFAPAPTLAGGTAARAFHGAGLLANGHVLVTGGTASVGSYGSAACVADCHRFDGTAWIPVGSLPVGVAFHTQETDPATGNALVMGGFTGEFGFSPSSAVAGIHDGTTFTQRRDIGQHALLAGAASQRAAHTCTQLQDGTFLVWGGQTPTALGTIVDHADGYVYVR